MYGLIALLTFFIIYFFIIFFYFLVMSKNKIIEYKVIKDPIIIKKNNLNYNLLKDKYEIKKCDQICKKEFCCEYETQMIKYDLCKECGKENKCYDDLKGICIPCKNNYTCEQLYGCSNKPPLNPIKNYCTRCWIQN